MSPLQGWRPLLRLAWRDALRSRARSALVLVMIALPVLGVVAADVVIATADVSGTEEIDRRLGSADAKVSFQPGRTKVQQDADPERGATYDQRVRGDELGDLETVRAVLGDDVRGIEWTSADVRMVTERGLTWAAVDRIDLADPIADGLWRVEQGRADPAEGEVVVNTHLATHSDVGIGDEVELADGSAFEVIGIGEHSSYRSLPMMAGSDHALVASAGIIGRTLLVDAGGPVTWADVRGLNEVGGLVVSRHVLVNPPAQSELAPEMQVYSGGSNDAMVAVAVLIAVMALIEVVLLAGPAFAVGARRQSRDLALMAATGGTPQQSRRVILAGALVLGGLGAALGVVLGIGVAAAAMPVVQHISDGWLGPFDVPVAHVLVIALFGLLSALLASVVPAWIASRQDPVAVLAGRRADRAPGLRSPILGVVLMGAGVAGAAWGALDGGEILIAASAIPTVLGMILLVPLVLAALGKASGALPLVLRYAVRDAARHRTRTVPAVAAVAATVAGVVALGVANASDAEQNRMTYQPQLAMGHGVVSAYDTSPKGWRSVEAAIERELPGVETELVAGLVESDDRGGGFSTEVKRIGGGTLPLSGWGGSLGASVLVVDERLPEALPFLGEADRAAARRVLAAGGAMVFADPGESATEVVFETRSYGPRGGRGTLVARETVAASVIEVPAYAFAPALAVVTPDVAAQLGVPVRTVGLTLGEGVTREQQRELDEVLAGIEASASVYVERGYQNADETRILLLVLGALGGLLMLGGTLTATFLALSDARPDLATLAAVGASPRARRGVAAAYAVVVGLVGAVLGALVGFIPGIAVTYPLTSEQWGPVTPGLPSHYLDVPWLLVGTLVLALPLLAAAVVGLSVRSRLPLVSRLT